MIGIFSRNILKAYFIVYKLVFSGKLRIYPVFVVGEVEGRKSALICGCFSEVGGSRWSR